VHRLHRVAPAHVGIPTLDSLILDLISLDYHETLLAAAGHQADAALKKAMADNKGKYVCIIEGAIPTKDGGIYCMIGGQHGDRHRSTKSRRRRPSAIIAIGSCASWGGVPSADPNPTGASGAHDGAQGQDGRDDSRVVRPIPTICSAPFCSTRPSSTLPELDELNRPKFAYGQTIHEHCPRRAHFDAGRFALEYGDPGHRQGWCLYRLGCKGPATHANCSVNHFNEVVGAWPIGLGHPCFGCTEQKLAFRVPLHDTVPIDRPTPPDTYPPIHAPQGGVSPVATGIAGLVGGAVVGAAWMAAKKLGDDEPKPQN
jgi:hydrogenase small subunit